MTKLLEQTIINRKSMDEGSESPKICSSLTKNQAAVLEYICQVRKLISLPWHWDFIVHVLKDVLWEGCPPRFSDHSHLPQQNGQADRVSGGCHRWDDHIMTLQRWLWPAQAPCTSTTPAWPPACLTTQPDSPSSPSPISSQMTALARERAWWPLLQPESVNHESLFIKY